MSLTVEELHSIEDATIPELRRIWDYNRNGDLSKRALAHLVRFGQVGPDGEPCVWGTVLHQHKIGDFTILETQHDSPYHDYAPDGEYRRVMPEEVADVRTFHVYVGDHNLGRSAHSLDEALLIAITWKYEEAAFGNGAAANSRGVTYYKRMIGMET